MLANLGYGTRREVEEAFRQGRVTDTGGGRLSADASLPPDGVRFDGAPLDPPHGMVVLLHKPRGFISSTAGPGSLVHDLLPPRFGRRRPPLSIVGRLDRDSTGMLLLTDDGPLLHRIASPRSGLGKIYEVDLAADLAGTEAGIFASGTLLLESEDRPLKPALLEALGTRRARVTLFEGRYHQLRRMFAAVGNHVEALHRVQIGSLPLGTLPEGRWRILSPSEREALRTPAADR